MTEYENEPIPGLPGVPPPGEQIIWQGSPDWRALARSAFHVRLVMAYFAALTGWAIINAAMQGIRGPGDLVGVGMTLGLGVAGLALLHLLAWGSARTTIYTLTNRRIVLRVGIAVPKCVNLPLHLIGAVDLAVRNDGTGDLPLTIGGQQKLGYLTLWPHARPWKIATPQPMLRAVPDAANVAALIARTCRAVGPGHAAIPETRLQPVPPMQAAEAA
jgi:hypothetical protein